MIWTALVILLIILAWYWFEGRWDRRLFQSTDMQSCRNLKSHEARKFLDTHPETQILDVRSAAECNGGMIPGAINISMGDECFVEKLADFDQGRPILVYCAGGYRSRKAVKILKTLGFSSILNLHRGYLSWRNSGA
jgi:rhodanese-related sulfurtransferase